MRTRPGEITLSLKFTGQAAADLIRMSKAAGKQRNELKSFVKSIVLHVIEDDRIAHESGGNAHARNGNTAAAARPDTQGARRSVDCADV